MYECSAKHLGINSVQGRKSTRFWQNGWVSPTLSNHLISLLFTLYDHIFIKNTDYYPKAHSQLKNLEHCCFTAPGSPFRCCLGGVSYVLPMAVRVSSEFCGFLPPPKKCWISRAKLPLDANECVNLCDGQASYPGCILPHRQWSWDRCWLHCDPD